jgi:ABC-type dipeptide/oligopeptide/nickel transport system permease component
VVRGTTIVIAFLFILANLIADLSYRFLDPRIELDETGGV